MSKLNRTIGSYQESPLTKSSLVFKDLMHDSNELSDYDYDEIFHALVTDDNDTYL